jgi:hypothetical protein
MSGNEFSHLEHADLALAVEDRPERFIRVDHGSLFLILTTILLDVVPKLLGKLGTWEWSRTNNGREFVVWLHRPHEGWIGLALGRSLFGFRHTG